jgi:cytochrome P450
VTGHEVIIPPWYMSWVLEQPDSVLSQFETNKQFLSAEHTMLHPSMADEKQWPRVANQIKREITKELDTVADEVVEEIQDALRETWGSNTQKWHELDLHAVCQEIMGRVVNRAFVGLPLCRDPGYLHCSIKFAQLVNVAATFIKLTPRLFRPFLVPLLTAYDHYQYRRMASYILPLIRERAAQFPPAVLMGEKAKGTPQPNDFIQWAIRDAYRHGEDPCEPTQVIAKRLAVITWAAIQSSAITITNALIDIAHSRDCDAILDELRAEALAAARYEPASNRWSRAALARLPKIDSVFTESLRLWGFVTRGVTKTVVAKEGITIPSGERLPYGSKVGIANYGPQHDERVYGPGSPFQFDAFRFSRGKEAGPLSGLSFVTTGEYYMGFSHGRHSW